MPYLILIVAILAAWQRNSRHVYDANQLNVRLRKPYKRHVSQFSIHSLELPPILQSTTPASSSIASSPTPLHPPSPPPLPDNIYIVRFHKYRMAAEHRSSLDHTLDKRRWTWIDRKNAAAKYPTDFGLIRAEGASLETIQVIENR